MELRLGWQSAFHLSLQPSSPLKLSHLFRSWLALFGGILLIFIIRFYVEQLPLSAMRWLLAPVATLVELQTGDHFIFNEARGYINTTGNIILTHSCAGYTFIFITWLMSFSFTWLRLRSYSKRIPAFFITGLLAVAFGVVVNSFRISLSMQMVSLGNELLSRAAVHEALGTFMYLSFLIVYFLFLYYRFKPSLHEKPA